jgi:hypothetical protein
MIGPDFRALLAKNKLSFRQAAILLGASWITIHRWAKRGVVGPTEILLRLWRDGVVSSADIERITASTEAIKSLVQRPVASTSCQSSVGWTGTVRHRSRTKRSIAAEISQGPNSARYRRKQSTLSLAGDFSRPREKGPQPNLFRRSQIPALIAMQ